MPRRNNDHLPVEEPPKKKVCTSSAMSSFKLKHGEFLTDLAGKHWKLGKSVGVGGFGEIYLASDQFRGDVKCDSQHVAKVESHSSGPLFVEINCYLRTAKSSQIEEWKTEKKLKHLGMPHYVSSGSHTHKGERYRFLILPRFQTDLEKILQEKKKLNLKTVLNISCQILEVLEYIHNKGYIHSDVKASNIMLTGGPDRIEKSKKGYQKGIRPRSSNLMRTCRLKMKLRCARNLRPVKQRINYNELSQMVDEDWTEADTSPNEKKHLDNNQVYLLDYGLACKYQFSNGEHKPYCVDERKAHAGTILFCSRDAHKGVPSRRSDLESLGYNMIYWLTETLPWLKDAEDPEIVAKKKQRAFLDPERFLRECFGQHPMFLLDYFQYLQKLQFQEQPDYNYCKKLFKQTLREFGYKDDSRLDFDNMEGWGNNQKKLKQRVGDNFVAPKLVYKISRPPLQSNNIPIKPLLRKKAKNKLLKNIVRWSQILIDNPEIIIKQAREKKTTETNDLNFCPSIAHMDIYELNPTPAMLEVFNKCKERTDRSPTYKGDSSIDSIDGYTPAMMSVHKKMTERKDLEYAMTVNIRSTKPLTRTNSKRKRKQESPSVSPPATRTAKSATVVKREMGPTRKMKTICPRRTYSLRG